MPVVIDQVEMAPEEPGRNPPGAEAQAPGRPLDESRVAELARAEAAQRHARDQRRWAH